jgi:hypothetical protein
MVKARVQNTDSGVATAIQNLAAEGNSYSDHVTAPYYNSLVHEISIRADSLGDSLVSGDGRVLLSPVIGDFASWDCAKQSMKYYSPKSKVCSRDLHHSVAVAW